MSTPTAAPFLDLRSFLAFLEQSDRLKRVSVSVDKDWEIACIARWALESARHDDAYAILFENVKDHDIPVGVNLYTTRVMYADALGVAEDTLLERWSRAMSHPIKPRAVESGPVQEIVRCGEAADLLSIPAPTWTPGRDAGPYLSAAAVITKDPESGVQNMGTYRIQIHDSRSAGLFFGSDKQHGAMHYAKYRQCNEPMPVALVVGAPPVVNFAAAAKTAYGVDEMDVAGGLAGVALEVVRAKSVDLLVPARAECIIEGLVSPDVRLMEGPFGEALGYMNPPAPAPVVKVTAISLRESPIHHGYVQQLPPSDGHLVMEMGVLGPAWHYLTRSLRLEGLRDLAIASGSAGLAILMVQIDGAHSDEAAMIGRTLAKINFGQRFICLVDEDIDIRDTEAVNWALSSRLDPERDLTIIPNASSYLLDPAVLARARALGKKIDSSPYESSMIIMDATLKGPVPEVSLPGRSLMQKTLDSWKKTGLPPISPRKRIDLILAVHTERDLHFSPSPAI